MKTKSFNLVLLVLALVTFGSRSVFSQTNNSAPNAHKVREYARTIKVPEFKLDQADVTQVIKQLMETSKKYDPAGKGIYFMISASAGNNTIHAKKITIDLKDTNLAEIAEKICQQLDGYVLRDLSPSPAMEFMQKSMIKLPAK